MSDETIKQVPVKELVPSKKNLRHRIGDVRGLQRSIADSGVLEPLIARENGNGKLEVVAGHRRLEASKRAGLKTVPVVVRDIDDRQLSKTMLIENVQREELTPLEEAGGYLRLVDDFDMTVKELADEIGRSQRHVSERLRLMQLDDRVAAKIDRGEVPLGALKAFEQLTGDDLWDELEEEQQEKAIEEMTGAWKYPDRVLSWTFRKIKQDRAIAGAREKAEQAGVTWADPTWDYGAPEPPGKILGEPVSSVDRDHLNVDKKAHRSEPCHALSVARVVGKDRTVKLKAVEICTDPGRHTRKNAPSEIKPPDYEEEQTRKAEERERRQQEKAEQEAYRAQVGRMIRGIRKTDGAKLLATLALDTLSYTDARKVCDTMGLDPVMEPDPFTKEDEPNWMATIRQRADQSDLQLVRTALAVLVEGTSEWSRSEKSKELLAETLAQFEEE